MDPTGISSASDAEPSIDLHAEAEAHRAETAREADLAGLEAHRRRFNEHRGRVSELVRCEFCANFEPESIDGRLPVPSTCLLPLPLHAPREVGPEDWCPHFRPGARGVALGAKLVVDDGQPQPEEVRGVPMPSGPRPRQSPIIVPPQGGVVVPFGRDPRKV